MTDVKIIGFRGFSIDWVHGADLAHSQPRLKGSFYSNYPWRPGINTADCAMHNHAVGLTFAEIAELYEVRPEYIMPIEHVVPMKDCSCGFWCLSKLKHAIDRGDPVIGVIQGWGKVVEHDTGWRCEKAQVIALLRQPPKRVIIRTSWRVIEEDREIAPASMISIGIQMDVLGKSYAVDGYGIRHRVELVKTEEAVMRADPEVVDELGRLYDIPVLKNVTALRQFAKEYEK